VPPGANQLHPRGFAPRTPLHALSRAASPARSVRVARSLRSLALTGLCPSDSVQALSLALRAAFRSRDPLASLAVEPPTTSSGQPCSPETNQKNATVKQSPRMPRRICRPRYRGRIPKRRLSLEKSIHFAACQPSHANRRPGGRRRLTSSSSRIADSEAASPQTATPAHATNKPTMRKNIARVF